MQHRSSFHRILAAGTSVLLAGVLVLAWAGPAAAVLPSFTGPTTVTVTTNATSTLAGSGAPQVVDPDTTSSMALRLTIGGEATVGRPTFTLDGTAGLVVSGGQATQSRSVTVAGTVAAINAALDGMRIGGGAASLDYTLTLVADESPTAAGGATTRVVTIEQRGTNPVNVMGPTFTVGTRASRTLAGTTAPQVSDADSPVLEVELVIGTSAGIPASEHPTFTLDGTLGLTVTGSVTASRSATFSGSITALNDALDGMVITGGATAGVFRLVLETDDVVGREAGDGDLSDTDFRNFTVTDAAPTVGAGPDIRIGTAATRPLAPLAPGVGDPDDDRVEVTVEVQRTGGDTTSTRPTFTFPATGLTVSAGSATASSLVTVAGPPAAIDGALDAMTLTGGPTAGTYRLAVTIDEAVGAAVGQTATDAATITVTAAAPTISSISSILFPAGTTYTLSGSTAAAVGDPDSPDIDLDVELLPAVGSTTVGSRFSLDGTLGLAVTAGSPTSSTRVLVTGPRTMVNDALDGMALIGAMRPETFRLVLTVDDDPGAGVGQTATRTISGSVRAAPPQTTAGAALTVASHSSSPPLVGAAAPRVGDPDSPIVDVEVATWSGAALPTEQQPTFTLDGGGAGLVISGSGSASHGVVLRGSPAAVNDALDGMVVRGGPTAGTFGIAIGVDDGSGVTPATSLTPVTVTDVTPTVDEPDPGSRVQPGQVRDVPVVVTDADSPGLEARIRVLGTAAARPQVRIPTPAGLVVDAGAATGALDLQVHGPTGAVASALAGLRVVGGSTLGTHTVEVTVDDARPEVGNTVTRTFTVVVEPVFAPFASAGAMVDRLHLDLLGRAPTAAERRAAVDGLTGGTLTPAGLVARLRGSADNLANVDPVTRLYQAYFLRIPDQAGLDFWIARRRSGQSLDQISQSFAQSAEFRTLYGSLGNRAFVERVYENVLGRPGEPDGVAFWTSQLDRGARTRGRVMTGFSESAEYKAQQRAAVDVSVAYIALLGRRPTNVEHRDAVADLELGRITLAALHTAILTGDEYRDVVT